MQKLKFKMNIKLILKLWFFGFRIDHRICIWDILSILMAPYKLIHPNTV